MPQRLPALALLLLALALTACGAVQPCNDLPRASTGLCTVGRGHESPG